MSSRANLIVSLHILIDFGLRKIKNFEMATEFQMAATFSFYNNGKNIIFSSLRFSAIFVFLR
jgi:hypothetical protein